MIDEETYRKNLDTWWDEILRLTAECKNEYLHAWDLSLKCPAIVVFDLKTFKPVHIQHFLAKGKLTHGERLYELYTAALHLQINYPPTELALERGFGRFHAETQALYRVHGVFNMAYRTTPQFHYPPKSVKAAVLHGDASKAQLQEYIKEQCAGVEFSDGDPGKDESDAYAVGITHMVEHKKMIWNKPVMPVKKRKPRAKPKPKNVDKKAEN